MTSDNRKQVEFLVVDTTAFIQNTPLHEVANTIITCQEVVDEITSKRQLRRLVALPYDLIVKDVFPENIKTITEFAKKTGDYPSLSATDIKVMALTYQLEKEKVGVEHLRTEPVLQKPEINLDKPVDEIHPDISGFYLPGALEEKFENLEVGTTDSSANDNPDNSGTNENPDDSSANDNLDSSANDDNLANEKEDSSSSANEEDDDIGWITPSNINQAKKQINSQLMQDKQVQVACMTTDFAMQNVLRQMNLNLSALDGRIINQLRTYILRCYTCFKTTSLMTKKFCPKCGNNTLKKVAVSLDDKGQMRIHINSKRPLTGRGKKFSLPKIRGGKHPNNPILVEDQPMADNRPTRLAKMKNNPLDDDYIAGFSPFIMRDVNSKSAQLGIRPGAEFKQWMKKNPNESRRRRK
ncbi:unnamed protein product [Ceutorhynchus assimilis]|uniref:RNA-binding protein NOB1 n=1 Tax=Ceutorhynchus assimilis TaxID=467358 RepID=A0A9N9QSA9_9CUCU|nr:unnamed protein product [Ceutorhynchus assimilis]